jgi:hypothetical protein
MKINWGHKLVFFTVLFMLFIIYMVYTISKQKVDLVDKNYYERGIKYQDEINKFNASSDVEHQVAYDDVQKSLSFTAKQAITGTLYFYRAGDENLDFKLPFSVEGETPFIYNTGQLKKGVWKATFEWKIGEKLMASEKNIEIK